MKLKDLHQALVTYTTDIFSTAWAGNGKVVGCSRGDSRLAFSTDSSEFGEGWTALHYACYQGHMEVVGRLLAGVGGGPKQSSLVNIATILASPHFSTLHKDNTLTSSNFS